MPPKRRNSAQRSTPKQFRCTGYGNCNMVFTRSEHLARHERKHTGEKPYKCIIEGCDRRFSRFDNMMQHTQTHVKERRKSVDSTVAGDHAKHKKACAAVTNDRVIESPHPWVQQDQNDLPLSLECSSMIHNRTLPPPNKRLSLSTPIPSSGSRSSYPYSLPSSPIKPHFYHASPFPSQPNTQRHRSPWIMKHEDEELSKIRRSSISTASSDSVHSGSPPSFHYNFNVKRRISIDALQMPIEQLGRIQLDEKPVGQDAFNITQDEYEVLEAFGQFCASPVVSSLTSSPVSSPSVSSQLCAIRQRVPTSKESFSRPASHHYLV
ncbi:hypothetical protein G6F55_012694 [Rhizopus delemar]|uniref:C2H2-type domain-containing protein n=2 Tax=Rhizopus TaxID=4842 RepID=A0A9P6Z7H8_9FUNG|nr:hypothetical protein G6F55_012694 [Rhizopus delemar]KAG1548351.1 hypothetical protein G6F51_003715 [Rhizopus arrhizus]KAG1561349.1 hypothetical protein G6F49_001892 [Rhizopus delemar]KAG1571994.1 hypothetical protein G6F50_004125 [Rhizopus delemar]KAG1591274.1 hypothetical protein G6F48_003393 [Rhizopus delemar]